MAIAEHPSDQLIDIEWPRPSRRIALGRILIALSIGMPCVFILLYIALYSTTALLIFGGLATLIAIAIQLQMSRFEREYREGRFKSAGENPADILATSLEFLNTASSRGMQQVCAFLIQREKLGVCARFAPAEAVWPVAPVQTTFEALPLDEFDPRFAEFRGPVSPAETSLVWRLAKRVGGPASARVTRQFWLRGGVPLLMYLAVLTPHLLNASRRGRFDWVAAYLAVLVVGASVMRWRQSWQGNTFHLLPGGLLVRRSARLGSRFHLRVFERSQSVLCVCPAEKGQWQFVVADRMQTSGQTITRVEVEALLAAWLSPLRPPTVAELDELA